tara:strand:- start:143 stop:1831 length:1689 start_codon:yes stop_codon:yes gene_type:complete
MAETRARFLADQIKTTDANGSFTLPSTRGTNNYVLTRDDSAGTGGTAWKETLTAPSITNITGEINEDTNTTLTVTGNSFASGMTLKLINATSGADITGHTALSYSGSSSPITVTIPSATTNLTPGLQVKLHITKSGLTATSDALTVSEDPNWDSTFVSNKATFATISDLLGASQTVGTLNAAAGAGGGTIVYASDDNSLNTTYFSLASNGAITTTSTALTGLTGSGTYTEAFNANAKVQGSESTKNTLLSGINIIVTKSPTGGNTINTNDWVSNYRIHVFTSNGTFVLSENKTVDILLVAGGGSGEGRGDNSNKASGGGAGGVAYNPNTSASSYSAHSSNYAYDITNSSITLNSGTYNIYVGAGGVQGTNGYNSVAGNGQDTYITSSVSGFSADQFKVAGGGYFGQQGGSGGGGNSQGNTGGAASAALSGEQGNNGGNSAGGSGGGGGGAGAHGTSTTGIDGTPGGGGDGRDYSSKFSTNVGESGWFAGGGGGARCQGCGGNSLEHASRGQGGGGGNTSHSSAGTSPVAVINNTGGGGGGMYSNSNVSSDGASGIVIIRYAV